jgi:protein-tyrosine phosphatase
MGRSRSVAIVVAYLMKKKQIDFEKARDLIRNKGREININVGFRQQLLIWDLIKEDWDNRETYAEYRYWRMANDAGIISRILRVLIITDFR